MINPIYLKLIEKGVDASKEFAKYINEMQKNIDELKKIQLEDYDNIVANLQTELDVIKHIFYDDNLLKEERLLLIEKMDNLNAQISLELAKKNEVIEKEKEEAKQKKAKALQIAAEVLIGIIPFTTLARAINQNKEKKTSLEHQKNEIISKE